MFSPLLGLRVSKTALTSEKCLECVECQVFGRRSLKTRGDGHTGETQRVMDTLGETHTHEKVIDLGPKPGQIHVKGRHDDVCMRIVVSEPFQFGNLLISKRFPCGFGACQ